MKPLLAVLSSAICVLALTTIATRSAHAQVSIYISSGFSSDVHRGHQRHPGKNVHRGQRRHNERWFRGGAPRPRFNRPTNRLHGRGCRPFYSRSHDRYGGKILLRETLCYDRVGRPFVLAR